MCKKGVDSYDGIIHNSKTEVENIKRDHQPVNSAIILSPSRHIMIQLDTNKNSGLPLNHANELDRSVHPPRRINLVAHIHIPSYGCCSPPMVPPIVSIPSTPRRTPEPITHAPVRYRGQRVLRELIQRGLPGQHGTWRQQRRSGALNGRRRMRQAAGAVAV